MSQIWLLMAGMGLITFALRLLPILLSSRRDPPPLVLAGLRMVPAAVLSALIVPDLLLSDAAAAPGAANPRLLAGGLAILVAWRTRNTALTLIAEMGDLWLMNAILT